MFKFLAWVFAEIKALNFRMSCTKCGAKDVSRDHFGGRFRCRGANVA